MSKTNVLLLGPIGTGKTHALRTVYGAGHRLLTLATEPGIDKILTHGELCHWHYVPPADPDWHAMTDNAHKVNTLTQETLMKMPGVNRQEYRQFIEVLNVCSNFTCDICGEAFGPVDALPANSVLACDGLSGLSIMAMDLVAGGKPVKTQADWGVAMDNLERLLLKLCTATKCSFVLCSHLDREVNELTGGTTIMVSTLGRKLAPKVPRFFDEVVACRREGQNFFWSTTAMNTDLKARRLPFSDEIPPDFGPLLAD